MLALVTGKGCSRFLGRRTGGQVTDDTCFGHVQLQIQLLRLAAARYKGGCHSLQSIEDFREHIGHGAILIVMIMRPVAQ